MLEMWILFCYRTKMTSKTQTITDETKTKNAMKTQNQSQEDLAKKGIIPYGYAYPELNEKHTTLSDKIKWNEFKAKKPIYFCLEEDVKLSIQKILAKLKFLEDVKEYSDASYWVEKIIKQEIGEDLI